MESEVAKRHLEVARAYEQADRSTHAFREYELYLESLEDPSECPRSVQEEVTRLAEKLGRVFQELENEELAVQVYTKVLGFFPENIRLLNLLAVTAFRRGHYDTARELLTTADSATYLPAEKNLLHVTWHQVPRWHFRMLNDHARNFAYFKAINRAISAGYRDVFDIGSGCGLLSLIAAKNDGATVTAFEYNRLLLDVARAVVRENGFASKVHFHCKKSTSFKVAPVPCNLIVTEVFDVALFGERALDTIKHALGTFVKPGAEGSFRIIPRGARLYVTGVESEKLASKYRFTQKLPGLELGNICISSNEREPYDAQKLSESNAKLVTETVEFLDVDFTSKAKLEVLSTCLKEIELPLTEDRGRIDALAVWFDLVLDEETVVSTRPGSDIKSWEQAIFSLRHPIEFTDKSDRIRVKPKLRRNKLGFDTEETPKDCRCFKASKEIVTLLNDSKLVEWIHSVASKYLEDARKKRTSVEGTRVLDFNAFPLFGLLMAKEGAKSYFPCKSSDDARLLKHVVKTGGIPEDNFVPFEEKTLSHSSTSLPRFDVVFTNFVSVDGCWERSFVCESLPQVSIPQKILLKAVPINSEYLDFCNKMDDAKAFGFGLDKHMNVYTGTEHPNIDKLDYSSFSPPVTIDLSDLTLEDFQTPAVVNRSGTVNGILFWFEMEHAEVAFSTFDSTHYARTCTILEQPRNVTEGDILQVRVKRCENYMKVYCSNP